jgi:hypothetical protein
MQKLLARYYGNVNPTLNSEEVEKYAREKAAYKNGICLWIRR